VFATNNSTRTARDVAARITGLTGYAAASEQVVTSAQATARHLAGAVAAVFVIGESGLVAALTEAGIEIVTDGERCDAVVVGLDRSIDYDKLATATLAVRSGARLIATNTDATFPGPAGQLPGAGTFVAAMERATGVEAEPCGKPHEPMAELVAARVGGRPVVMVGDRIETDVAFGRRHGWTTVLVLTGVTTAHEAGRSDADRVLASIADLPDLLETGAGA
jgi:4-nitrophenyl phosphatase